MPGITGQGNTYNLPNYVGELFAASREDTPLLSAIGGLTGGIDTTSTLFEWQGYDLRDPDANRQRLEGADAPKGEERTRFHANNVVEIHQEAVEVSYTRQGATGQRNTDNMPVVQVGGTAIPADELSWQIQQQLKQIARDVEASFISGHYNNPTDNQSARSTRGLLEAITTNVMSTEHTAAQLTADDVLDLAQMAWDNGGIRESETRTIVVNSTLKRALTRCFVTDAKYQEQTRNVGGVNLQTIETDFGPSTSCSTRTCRRTSCSSCPSNSSPRASSKSPARVISSPSRSPRPAQATRCSCTARSACSTATRRPTRS